MFETFVCGREIRGVWGGARAIRTAGGYFDS
jgi:hypothetical protein